MEFDSDGLYYLHKTLLYAYSSKTAVGIGLTVGSNLGIVTHQFVAVFHKDKNLK